MRSGWLNSNLKQTGRIGQRTHVSSFAAITQSGAWLNTAGVAPIAFWSQRNEQRLLDRTQSEFFARQDPELLRPILEE